MRSGAVTITGELGAWSVVCVLGILLVLDVLLLIRTRPAAHSTETILFAALALLFVVALLVAIGLETGHITLTTA